MKNRLLCIVLCITMILSNSSAAVSAQEIDDAQIEEIGILEEENIDTLNEAETASSFSDYLIRVIDKDSGKPLPGASVMLGQATYVTDNNGVVKLMTDTPDMGEARVMRDGYLDGYFESVTLSKGEICDLPIERDLDFNPPGLNMAGTTRISGNEVKIKNESTGQTENINTVDLPFTMGIKTDFAKANAGLSENTAGSHTKLPVSVEYDREKQVISVAWGYSSDGKVKEPYNWTRDAVEVIKRSKSGSPAYLKQVGTKIPGKFGVTADVYYLGYAKIKIQNGDMVPIVSGAVVAICGNGALPYRLGSDSMVCCGKISMEPDEVGGIALKFDPELGAYDIDSWQKIDRYSGESYIDSTLDISIPLTMEAATAGTHFDIGTEGELSGGFSILGPDGRFSIVDDLSLIPDVEPYLTASGDLGDGDTGSLFPGGDGSGYVENNVSLVSLSDGTQIAAWTDLNESKLGLNRPTVYYAVGKNGVFGEKKPVRASGYLEIEPMLYTKGDTAFLLYESADRIFAPKEKDPGYIAQHINLYLSVFDASTGTFNTPLDVVSGSGKKPLFFRAAGDGEKLTVCWVENSDNNLFLTSGENTIYARTYSGGAFSEITQLLKTKSPIIDLDLAYADKKLVLAFTADEDGDPSTAQDSELYRLVEGGKVERLTQDEADDTFLSISGEDLFFVKDGIIRRMSAAGTDAAVSTGVCCHEDFRVLSGKGGRAILFFDKEEFVSVPMISYERKGAYTPPVPLTSLGSVGVDYYGATYEEDGVTLLCSERSIDTHYDFDDTVALNEQSLYADKAYLRLHSALIPSELFVDTDLYYKPGNCKPGNELEFIATIHNRSGEDISSLWAALFGSKGKLEEKEISVSIPAGEKGELHFPFTVTEDTDLPQIVSLYVSREAPVEKNGSMKTYPMKLGEGNLEFKDIEVIRNDDGSATVSPVLRNTGYTALQKIDWKLIKNDVPSEHVEATQLIGESKNLSMNAGASCQITQMIPSEFLRFDGAGDENVFTLQVETIDEESCYYDNDEIITIRPVEPESVKLQQESLSMKVGETASVTTQIEPADAFEQCYFTSSDPRVAYVEGDGEKSGTVCAVSPGKAVITVFTALGDIKDSIEVEVGEDNTGDARYYFEKDVCPMENGKTSDVLLKWESLSEGAEKSTSIMLTSTDPSVAEVEEINLTDAEAGDGSNVSKIKLKAKGEGSTVVTASIGDKPYKAVCVVNVTDGRARFAAFTQKSLDLVCGESGSLSLKCLPASSAGEFVFESLAPDIAAVDESGVVTALKPGITKVKAVCTSAPEGEEPLTALCRIRVSDSKDVCHSLSFDTNGGSAIEERLAYQLKLPGEAFTFPSDPVLDGFTFAGWNTDPEGNGAFYPTDKPCIAGKDVLGSLELYAVWEKADDPTEPEGDTITDYVYTGKKIRPKVVVRHGDAILTEGVDYTLKYKNNLNAGSKDDPRVKKRPTVIVKGKGKYKGRYELYFDILPVNLEGSARIIADDLYANPKKKAVKPSPVILFNGKALKKKNAYTVSSNAFTANGEYKVAVTGKGNFTGTRILNFIITDKPLINGAKVTGNASSPEELGLKLKKKDLVRGKDYELNIYDDPGTGITYAVFTGKGEYAGIKRVSLSAAGTALKKAKVANLPRSVTYDGDAVTVSSNSWKLAGGGKPELTVRTNAGVQTLVQDKDYTVSYEKNSGCGKARIIFTGIGRYKGTLKKTFKITPYDLEKDEGRLVSVSMDSAVPYVKDGAVPNVVLTFKGEKLREGRDYVLSCSKNKKAGDKAEAVITGKGNFCGKLKRSFTVKQQDSGEPGSAKSLSGAKVVISPQVYTGKSIRPGKDAIKVTLKGNELKSESYEIVSYGDNTEPGKGSVLLHGVGEYGGYKRAFFVIRPGEMDPGMAELR